MKVVNLRDEKATPHPLQMFGTYKVGFLPASASGVTNPGFIEGEDITQIVTDALEVGFRAFDCAQYYGNETEIGRALSSCTVPRSELFIASKVWSSTIYEGSEAVQRQVLESLERMGLDYFDLYLIHWPVPGKHIQAYKALEELAASGKIRNLGVSNYTIEDYIELEKAGLEVPVTVNQIEVNPFMFRRKTIEFFQSKGIVIQAYRSLAKGKLDYPLLLELKEKYKAQSASSIMGQFLMQQNIVFLSKSSKKARIKENFDIGGLTLDEDDLEKLKGLTTKEAIATNAELYRKCCVRDTPLSIDLVSEEFTRD